MKKNNKVLDDNEVPRSVLKMKQEKQIREENNNKKNIKKNNKLNKKLNTNNKSNIDDNINKKKPLLRKLFFLIFVILLIYIIIRLIISAITFKQLTDDMFVNKNSVVVDTNGEVIAKLGVEQKKLTTTIENIPQNLLDAYVSIEDERFYLHHGIDIKRTGGAILSYITTFGNSSYGGSTITQQLVKNLTGDSTDSITRKVKEWWKAFLLECYYSKEEILEMYLNVIYVGPNMYGVRTGAKYYFNKDIGDLSLAECAYLAGINNSPNSYNPFENDTDNLELIINRTLTVLDKMKELGKITDEEYEEAVKEVNEGLDFDEGEIETENPIFSYHTDALISEVIQDISKDKNISEDFALNYIYLSGLTIHSTQNSDIQEIVEDEFLKNRYILKSSKDDSTSQAAMCIINHQTGEVLACRGGLGEKEVFRGLNRAVQSKRQTGSAIKPIAVLVPGIDKKIFTGASIYDDKKTTFENDYTPTNNDGGYLGKITVRRALESSQNIPFVEMMEEVTPKRSIEYLEKMGITSLTKEDESLVLALGGLQIGITPLEMSAAYATIANDGVYIEPTFYTSVIDQEGKIVLKSRQETRKVFSDKTAYILKELLKQPVEGKYGTATYCKISGIDVAAKTGTTDENYDKWLCGFTPYYTAVTWFGFDTNESIEYNNQNPAEIIWANVMKNLHSGLENASFSQPRGIEVQYICEDTGMIAKTGCNNTYVEYFLTGTVPEMCNKHLGSKKTSNANKDNVTEEKVSRNNYETKNANRDENGRKEEEQVEENTAELDNEENEKIEESLNVLRQETVNDIEKGNN